MAAGSDCGAGEGRNLSGLAAVLVTLSIGYWALLVYLPLFLGAGFGWPRDLAGLWLLAATLPMVLLSPFGARLVRRLGLARLFLVSLMLLALGGCLLVMSTLLAVQADAFPWAVAGMLVVGVGAALSNPQLSGAVVALAPPASAGMASAVSVIARQASFAMGVALLGAMTPSDLGRAGFAWPFGLAALASVLGVLACLFLLSPSPGSRTAPD